MSGQGIVISPDAFGQFKVKEMNESDFWLGSATPISLKSPKCHIILFYEPTSVDPGLITAWNLLAQTIAGPVIAAVNTSARGEIMDAFLAVESDIDNPLNDFTGFGVPTIMVYRNRWPQAFYNGELSYDALKKWILVLACKPGYKERQSRFHGIRAVVPDEYIDDPRIENFPYPTSSRDFTAFTGESTRGGDGQYVDDSQGQYYDQSGEEEAGQYAEDQVSSGDEQPASEELTPEELDIAKKSGIAIETPQDVGFIDESRL